MNCISSAINPSFVKPLAGSVTLNVWAKYWLEVYVKPVSKPGGYEHYHDNMCKHILPVLGEMELNSITTAVVQQFFNVAAVTGNLKTGGPLSAKSMKNMRVTLDVCLKRAVADGHMQANPVPMTVLKHCKSKRVDVLTDGSQRILEKWLFENKCSESAAIQLAMFTGCRLGEVCALRWKNYDAADGRVHFKETVRRISKNDDSLQYGKRTELVFSSPKTDSSERTIYLPEFLLDVIENQRQRYSTRFGIPGPDDFVFFSTKGGVLDPDNLSAFFRKTLEHLGLPHIKFHALRHTFATRAVENGIDVATVSGILGHASVTTTTYYYVRPRDDAMRRAMVGIRPVG